MSYSFNPNFDKFRKNISLTEEDRQGLLGARKGIRDHIRNTFKERKPQYFDKETSALIERLESPDRPVVPRFMTQGSFAYGTINKPARPPKQQMDLDDGVYFPVTYVSSVTNGPSNPPKEAASVLREIVYKCMCNLAQKNRWQCIKKDKCIRVTISRTAHIDLPVYSVPDEEMETIREAMARAHTIPAGKFIKDAKNVFLATDDGWIKSDPRVIHKWVEDSKRRHEKRFIDYSRYLKAWRDRQWESSKFSSIMIMAGVEAALSEQDYFKEDNVALDLGFVVKKISAYLGLGGKGIGDPDSKERMDQNLDNRDEIINCLTRLENCLKKAVKNGEPECLVSEFGGRFPDDQGRSDVHAEKPIAGAVVAPTPVISSPTIRPSKKC